MAATVILEKKNQKQREKTFPNKVKKGWKPKDDAQYKLLVEKRIRDVKGSVNEDWVNKNAEEKCRSIEAILGECASTQAKVEAYEPIADDKVALRRLIEDRKRARCAGDKEGQIATSKRIQKELRAIEKARRSARVQSILEDFCDLKRLEKTRTRKAAQVIGSMQASDGTV